MRLLTFYWPGMQVVEFHVMRLFWKLEEAWKDMNQPPECSNTHTCPSFQTVKYILAHARFLFHYSTIFFGIFRRISATNQVSIACLPFLWLGITAFVYRALTYFWFSFKRLAYNFGLVFGQKLMRIVRASIRGRLANRWRWKKGDLSVKQCLKHPTQATTYLYSQKIFQISLEGG